MTDHVGNFDSSSVRRYTFKSNNIPRLSVKDPEVFNRMRASVSFNSLMLPVCIFVVLVLYLPVIVQLTGRLYTFF